MLGKRGKTSRGLNIAALIAVIVLAVIAGYYLLDWFGPVKSREELTVTVTSKRIDQTKTYGRKAYQRHTYSHYRVWFERPDGPHGMVEVGTLDEYIRLKRGKRIKVTSTVRFWGDTVYRYNRKSK